jgi:hypothetical protein
MNRDASALQQFLGQRADADRATQRVTRRTPSKKQLSVQSVGASSLKVSDQGISHLLRKREAPFPVRFPGADQDASTGPIDVVDPQSNHFTRAVG